MSYIVTSEGTNWKNQGVTSDPEAVKSADHYNVIGSSGLHLTMGNEGAVTTEYVQLSLRGDSFLKPSSGTATYWVNQVGGGVIGWRGYEVYSDRFSSDGVNQWFGLNADNSKNTLLAKKMEFGSLPCNGGGNESGFEVYKATYTVTYKNWNGDTLQGPDTVEFGADEPAAPVATRPADDECTYTFKEWVKTYDDKGNVTYTASYTQTPKPSDDPTDTTTTVVVTDEDGGPVVGAKVTVVCDGKEVASYTTDGTENKTVVLESGECTVHVDAPSGYDDPADKPAVPGGDTEFTVEKTKQDVTVTIVDSETSDVLTGKVDIYSGGTKVAEGVNSGDTVKLPAGTYTAKQSGDIEGYNKAGDKTFTVTDKAETVTLTAKAKPSTVTITVTDREDGTPIDVRADIVCGQIEKYVTGHGKIVFYADAGICTVTLSADNYESNTIRVNVPGRGEPVTRNAELTSSSLARSGYIDGNGNRNKDIRNAVPNAPTVKSLDNSYGDDVLLARTGAMIGLGLTITVLLVVAGIFLVVKRRSEH